MYEFVRTVLFFKRTVSFFVRTVLFFVRMVFCTHGFLYAPSYFLYAPFFVRTVFLVKTVRFPSPCARSTPTDLAILLWLGQ
jgi:hypothetical protein